MIEDLQFRSDVTVKWNAIRSLCHDSHRQYAAGGAIINETRPAEAFNLPFLLAYALLDELLDQYGSENGIAFRRRAHLGEKMASLQTVLTWSEYAQIDEGMHRRNDLAHRAELLPKAECLRFIKAIDRQLSSWGMVSD